MFDIGFWEIIVLGAVALVVVGPEQMPGLVRTMLGYFRHFQRQFRDLRTDVERELNMDGFEQKSLKALLEDDAKKIGRDIEGEFAQIKQDVENGINDEDFRWDDPDRFDPQDISEQDFDDSDASLPDPDLHADTGEDTVGTENIGTENISSDKTS